MAGNGKMTWQRWDFLANEPKKIGQIRDGDGGAGLMETLLFARGGNFLMAGRQAQGTWNAALSADDSSSAQRRSSDAAGITLLCSAILRRANSAKASGERGLEK